MTGKKIQFNDGINTITTFTLICDYCNKEKIPFVCEFAEIPPFGINMPDRDIFICGDCIKDFIMEEYDLFNLIEIYKKPKKIKEFFDEFYNVARYYLPSLFYVRRKSLSPRLREIVLRKFGYRCVRCGTNEGLSIDHIKPVSKGGSDEIDNLQVLCKSCNSKKGNK